MDPTLFVVSRIFTNQIGTSFSRSVLFWRKRQRFVIRDQDPQWNRGHMTKYEAVINEGFDLCFVLSLQFFL